MGIKQANPNLWLEKATLSTSDLTGGTDGGLLSNDQAMEFLRVAIDYTAILPLCRVEFSKAPSFEVPRLSFGSRVLKPGTEGSRLADGDRVKPSTGLMTLATVLLRGEVPVSDEVFEDNVEKDKLADTIMTMVAQAVGRDIEELMIKGDSARDTGGGEDAYLDLIDGLVKRFQAATPAGQKLDMSAGGAPTTYDEMLGQALQKMPARYRRNVSDLKFFLPVLHTDGYEKSLSGRGTALGDKTVIEGLKASLAYRGIQTIPVPIMTGTDLINAASVDYDKFGLLTDPKNIVAGFHREVKIEKWRDPREGATSFVPSVRFDVDIADPNGTVLIHDIPTTLT